MKIQFYPYPSGREGSLLTTPIVFYYSHFSCLRAINQKNNLLNFVSFKFKCPQDQVYLSPEFRYQAVQQTLSLFSYSIFLSNHWDFWYVLFFYVFVQHERERERKRWFWKIIHGLHFIHSKDWEKERENNK